MIAVTTIAVCAVLGGGAFAAPDNGCTPGAYDRLTRREVCATKIRHSLRAFDRRWIVMSYRVPSWDGEDGELDHRVPFFLGGRTNRRNVWPQRGPIPNRKDKLEGYVRRRVCEGEPYRMSVRTARRMFLADWRHAYHAYFRDLVL